MGKLELSRYVLNLEDHLPLLRTTAALDRNIFIVIGSH